jgi:hypothetical protein
VLVDEGGGGDAKAVGSTSAELIRGQVLVRREGVGEEGRCW